MTTDTWSSIAEQEGSVQHLDCLSDDEKAVFKTAFEIDQRWVIELAADRTPFICQSQSVNLFLPADIDKWDLHMLHCMAWKRGVKSLYYCRSLSLQRADNVSEKLGEQGDILLSGANDMAPLPLAAKAAAAPNYEECLACQ